ncbi:MAG: efflux RND transporter permease subunit [Phycisphaerales bacterium]
MRNITDLFIRKPALAWVCNLIILVVGLRAALSLPIQQYPRIESSSIIITTVYIGASAESIRGFITTPIERAVSSVNGIDYVESQSLPGVSRVTVRLRLNHPSSDALAELSARLDQVRSELPREAESPVIDIQRADRAYASFYISFVSDTMSPAQLTEYLSRVVQPELGTLQGVQRAGIEGARLMAMRVWLNPDRLAALNVTPEEVANALRRNNYLAAVGRTKGDSVQLDLMADTDLRSADEFERLIVRESDGAVVRLGDLATIELGSEEAEQATKKDGRDAVFVSIWPLPGINEIELADRLEVALARLEPTLPAGVHMSMAFDATMYMRNSLKEIAKTLTETVLIVAVVVFLFMGSIRTALVPLVAMPISLVGAAIFMSMMGFSLNLLTILAVVLSVGLVVDDAIVVVENVERHVREGMSRIQAALVGARELVNPVIAMTITLAVVYTPIGFQGGLTGVLFKEFAFTLAAAVVVSGIVAITLSPIMSAALVPEGGRQSRMTRWVNARFESIRRIYAGALSWSLSVRGGVVAAGLLVALAAFPLYRFSAKELAPVEDQGFVFFMLNAPPDSSLPYIERYGKEVTDAFLSFPEARFVFQLLNPSGGFGGMITKDWRERARSTLVLNGEAMGRMSRIAGLQPFSMTPASLPGAGMFDVELVVSSFDPPERMVGVADELVQAAFGSGLFMYADKDLKLDMPQMRVMIDRDVVADLGLDLARAGGEMAVYLAGGYTNRFNYEGRSYKVIPQIDPRFRGSAEKLLDLKVSGRNGAMIPVSAFASLQRETGPRTLNRFQQRNAVKVFGGVPPGITKAEALDALEAAARRILPPGYSIDYAGESRQIRTEGSKLAVTLGFALALIYLVLAAQFASFRDPLVVLLGSVPLALSGALAFTFLDFTTINIYSQVGLITLVGLVAKNGILIVEWANHLQEQGRSKVDAVREAALTRLRPVLMTSAATVFGHLPLVFVTGPGAVARNSIGIVLVTGMVIGTFFTLFAVPSVYVLLAGRRAAHAPEGDQGHAGPGRDEGPAHRPLPEPRRPLKTSGEPLSRPQAGLV